MGHAGDDGTTFAPEAALRAGPLGRLPAVVRGGVTIALLIVVAAVGAVFLPVSATVDPAEPGTVYTYPRQVHCGSVVRPAGDDALADDTHDAAACGSARVQRLGWIGVGLGGAFAVLLFTLLMGDGMSGPPEAASPETGRMPEEAEGRRETEESEGKDGPEVPHRSA